MSEHDAAYLRMVFYKASEEMILAFSGKSGKLSKNWRMSKEDEYIASVWARMYEAIRDAEGGLYVLKEIEQLREELAKKQAEVDALNAELLKQRPKQLEVKL